MKELLERIRQLQEKMEEKQQPGEEAAPAAALLSVFRELNPNEMLARNTPKFEMERKEANGDTRVEIYCAAKPRLLLSMVNTLDVLGIDIQQCVVIRFNDFAMHASCSEMQKEMLSADTIKQQLFKNAVYWRRPLVEEDRITTTTSNYVPHSVFLVSWRICTAQFYLKAN